MSLEATVWALKKAPVEDQAQVLTLIGLADHAHDDGTCAWPSVQKLAEYARCSVRSVQRHLKALEDAGVIRRGDQSIIPARIPGNRRPVVWDLDLNIVRGDIPSPAHKVSGVTQGALRGDNPGSSGVTLLADKPSLFLTEETILEPERVTTHDEVTADFEAFYELYPRKIGRGQAVKAYRTARKITDADTILKAVKRYPFNREQPQFIPYPATWLNGERWADALPGTTPATRDDVVRRQGGVSW